MSCVELQVCGMSTRQYVTIKDVLVVNQLPPGLADSMATPAQLRHYLHLQDIPIFQNSPRPVQLLIGQNCPVALAPLDSRVGPDGTPFAIKTRLGWAVSGPMKDGASLRDSFFLNCVTDGDPPSIEEMLERLWRAESACKLDENRDPTSAEDRKVFHLWEQQGSLVGSHYQLPIPFKNSDPQLPDNLTSVQRRLYGLKRRLQKDTKLLKRYTEEMNKILENGHAERVPWRQRTKRLGHTWYIPHHPVFNPNKPDKLRIVFDCAMMHHGVSLNKEVAQGPDSTNGLLGVLLRFRKEPIALMADIEAMFHQVQVSERHRDALRFLWWPAGDLSTTPATYRMTVHLFGGVWSPACASYALRRTFREFGSRFPTAKTHLTGFYVDDLLISVPSLKEAIHTASQLQELTACGGFRLTKWISNRREVLITIAESERHTKVKEVDISSAGLPVERALGLVWDLEEDIFGIKITSAARPSTKRGLLGVVSAVYDPLGFLCPVTVTAKLLFQDQCRKKLGWDEPLCPTDMERWEQWVRGLETLRGTKVPRCYFGKGISQMSQLQLHHFCDASQVAYATVTYLRGTAIDGTVSCAFVCGRSRLAPIKQLTVPRLELCAAVLAVKVDQNLKRELQIALLDSVFWTDSMIVLGYIANERKRFHTFVANRLAYIQEAVLAKQWRHVRSECNPADDATRGLSVEEMKTCLWLKGPVFLKAPPEQWPSATAATPVQENDPEVKREVTTLMNNCQSTNEPLRRLWERYSSWYELKRAVAWLRMVFKILKGTKSPSNPPSLKVSDFKEAEMVILKRIQLETYGEDLKRIMNRMLPRSSHLYPLEPYLSDGLIRVGGRLRLAQPDMGEPILLPTNHPVTRLIISETHCVRAGHSGREHTLALLREQYWVAKPRSVIDRVLRQCVICRRNNFRPHKQREADLPADRISPGGLPFCSTGLDAFGPFMVTQGRRRVKRFGCLFTCMRTRAVHLEVLDSMDADALLNAIARFVSRRGTPEVMRSDNGTNMIAASKELKKAMRQLGKDVNVAEKLRRKGITWLFNPPAAPHMGGAWERLIGISKRVLRAVIGTQSIDDYRLMTLFCETEAVINSRPITQVSNDPNDLEALTPGHLLRGGKDPGFPLRDRDWSSSYRRRWQHVQAMAERFWKRFVREYLPTLRRRHRHIRPSLNIKEGDLVIVFSEDTPRCKWPLGRVTKVTPGTDGLVRRVTVRTEKREMVRPVEKLCLLEGVTE